MSEPLLIYDTNKDKPIPISTSAQNNPVIISVNGKDGDIIEKKLFIRNKSSRRWFQGVVISMVREEPQNFGVKILLYKPKNENDKPTIQNWNNDGANTIIWEQIGSSIGADTKYHPFWIRVETTKGIDAEISLDIKLKVESTIRLIDDSSIKDKAILDIDIVPTTQVIDPQAIPPVFTSTPPSTGQVGEAFAYQANAEGPGTISFSKVPNAVPNNFNINTQGLILWTPLESQIGNQSISIIAANEYGSTIQTFIVNVEATPKIPVFTSSPPIEAEISVPYVYTAIAIGDSPITFSKISGPSNFSIDSSSGVVTWTPSTVQTENITIRATNNIGSTNQSFSVNVESAPANPPVIQKEAGTIGTIGLAYKYDADNVAFATGTPPITWSKIAGPAGFIIDSNGVINWTPSIPGNIPITIRATNSSGFNDYTFNVFVGIVPNITSSPLTSIIAGNTYTYNPVAIGTTPLLWSIVTAPSTAQINSTTGVVTWHPISSNIGNNNFTIRATNSHGTTTQSWVLNVQPSVQIPLHDVVLNIDYNDEDTEISKYIYGISMQNITNTNGLLHSTIFSASTDPIMEQTEINGVLKWLDYANLIAELKPSIIHGPGGSSVSNYRQWEWGIGYPIKNRIPNIEINSSPSDFRKTFGPLEYAEFVNRINTINNPEFPCELAWSVSIAQVASFKFLGVEFGDFGYKSDARNMVEYFNGSSGSWAEKRNLDQNNCPWWTGQPGPINVKFWNIGNEFRSPPLGLQDAKIIGPRTNEFVTEMKRVQTENNGIPIQCFAVGYDTPFYTSVNKWEWYYWYDWLIDSIYPTHNTDCGFQRHLYFPTGVNINISGLNTELSGLFNIGVAGNYTITIYGGQGLQDPTTRPPLNYKIFIDNIESISGTQTIKYENVADPTNASQWPANIDPDSIKTFNLGYLTSGQHEIKLRLVDNSTYGAIKHWGKITNTDLSIVTDFDWIKRSPTLTNAIVSNFNLYFEGTGDGYSKIVPDTRNPGGLPFSVPSGSLIPNIVPVLIGEWYIHYEGPQDRFLNEKVRGHDLMDAIFEGVAFHWFIKEKVQYAYHWEAWEEHNTAGFIEGIAEQFNPSEAGRPLFTSPGSMILANNGPRKRPNFFTFKLFSNYMRGISLNHIAENLENITHPANPQISIGQTNQNTVPIITPYLKINVCKNNNKVFVSFVNTNITKSYTVLINPLNFNPSNTCITRTLTASQPSSSNEPEVGSPNVNITTTNLDTSNYILVTIPKHSIMIVEIPEA